MKVFKATHADMSCSMGTGTFRYELGKTYTAAGCKCGKTGLHSCEYILGCMGYYAMDGKNRFFVAEAGGDIHEVGGDDTRVSSTELTLVKELDRLHICYEAMRYQIDHPGRPWQSSGTMLRVQPDRVEVGGEGASIGLLHEEEGEIVMARVFRVDENLEDRWLKITPRGDLAQGGAE